MCTPWEGSAISKDRFESTHHPSLLLVTSSLFSWPRTHGQVWSQWASPALSVGALRLLSSFTGCLGGGQGMYHTLPRDLSVHVRVLKKSSGDGKIMCSTGFSPRAGLCW